MEERISLRIDKETYEVLEKLQKELKISKSDVIRMAINYFANYVKKVSK